MGDSPLNLSCNYYRFSEYEIKDGIIRPTASSKEMKIIKYNPFDHFKSTLDKRPKHTHKINELPIHVSFSTLKSNEDALEWVNEYGLPYSYYVNVKSGEIVCKNFPTLINSPKLVPFDNIPANDICKHALVFYDAINLYNMIKEGLSEDIHKLMSSNIVKKNYDCLASKSKLPNTGAYKKHIVDEIAELWDNTEPCPEEVVPESDPYYLSLRNEPISLAQDFLSMLISYSTNSVRETLIFDQNLPEKPPKIGFIFSSLLALLYKMLLLDWSQGYSVQRCANKNCNKMFVPFNDKSNYCCKACGDCVRSQRQRDKKKMSFINAI